MNTIKKGKVKIQVKGSGNIKVDVNGSTLLDKKSNTSLDLNDLIANIPKLPRTPSLNIGNNISQAGIRG